MKSRELLLALSLTGCVHQQSFLEQIHEARSRWQHAICRTPQYKLVSLVPSIDRCSGVSNTYYGCYDRTTKTVQISAKVPSTPGLLYQVITHEMGHALGPGYHVEEGQGLMSPYTNTALPVITEADLALICKEYDCPCQNPEAP